MSSSVSVPGTTTIGIGKAPAVLAVEVTIGPGPSAPALAAEHQHRNVDIALDRFEDLLRRGTFANDALGRDPGEPVGASGCVIERRVGFLMRLRAHDVGDATPFLIALVALDHPQHHHSAAAAFGPACGVVDRAIAFRRVVDHDKAFRFMAGFVAPTFRAHQAPRIRSRPTAAPSVLMLPWRRTCRQAR